MTGLSVLFYIKELGAKLVRVLERLVFEPVQMINCVSFDPKLGTRLASLISWSNRGVRAKTPRPSTFVPSLVLQSSRNTCTICSRRLYG